jgi:hypothetical protein
MALQASGQRSSTYSRNGMSLIAGSHLDTLWRSRPRYQVGGRMGQARVYPRLHVADLGFAEIAVK